MLKDVKKKEAQGTTPELQLLSEQLYKFKKPTNRAVSNLRTGF